MEVTLTDKGAVAPVNELFFEFLEGMLDGMVDINSEEVFEFMRLYLREIILKHPNYTYVSKEVKDEIKFWLNLPYRDIYYAYKGDFPVWATEEGCLNTPLNSEDTSASTSVNTNVSTNTKVKNKSHLKLVK